MPKLSNWFRKKIQHAHNIIGAVKDPDPPVLPSERQQVLTPSSSRPNLSNDATSNSSFFELLPPELRRQVYIHAFGGRVVHMDLRFDHPWRAGSGHAGLDSRSMSGRDRATPPAWIWWSGVCHRHCLIEHFEWQDQCRTASGSTLCSMYLGEMPKKCFVGAMGWLLTCRQAYVEGIDVLYRTDRFHIGSVILMRHLPLLLLPQRLTSISSLELVWDLHLCTPRSHPTTAEAEGWSMYDNLVQVVTSACPSLEKLHISVLTGFYITEALADATESYDLRLLSPIDEMVRKLRARMRHCQISPPLSLHKAMMSRAKNAGARTDSGGAGILYYQRFWRPVTVPEAPYPENKLGYWVRQGKDDRPVFRDGPRFGT